MPRPISIPIELCNAPLFWARVIKRDGGCWLWRGMQNRANTGGVYGKTWFAGKFWKAHRVAYTLTYGPIPDGLTLDHKCKIKLCCNPDHLEPVTQSENVLRHIRANRKILCDCGNDIVRDGRCRACHNAYYREYRINNRAKCKAIAQASYERIGRDTRRKRLKSKPDEEPKEVVRRFRFDDENKD